MITAIVLYDLPAHIDKEACRSHFHAIAPGFLEVPGLIRKQFIHAVEGGVAGGSYLWESRRAAEAFYSGPWREGIISRYGSPPRISYFDTFAIADVPAGQATTMPARQATTMPARQARTVPARQAVTSDD